MHTEKGTEQKVDPISDVQYRIVVKTEALEGDMLIVDTQYMATFIIVISSGFISQCSIMVKSMDFRSTLLGFKSWLQNLLSV